MAYINDIGKLKVKCNITLFPDDCVLLYSTQNMEENTKNLQSDVILIDEYFNLNKLTLNVDQTKFINVYTKNGQIILKILLLYYWTGT